MAKLLIDGRAVEAAESQTILDAARMSGIAIPTLCWYPRCRSSATAASASSPSKDKPS